jgi:hypothetical protein
VFVVAANTELLSVAADDAGDVSHPSVVKRRSPVYVPLVVLVTSIWNVTESVPKTKWEKSAVADAVTPRAGELVKSTVKADVAVIDSALAGTANAAATTAMAPSLTAVARRILGTPATAVTAIEGVVVMSSTS